MEFIISRASDYHGIEEDVKPCDEAYKIKKENWETRTCSEEEFNKKFSDRQGLWRSKGKNHCITSKGYIQRQMEDEDCWVVKISSLEELHNFIKHHGELIVSSCVVGREREMCIEIYDDYVE